VCVRVWFVFLLQRSVKLVLPTMPRKLRIQYPGAMYHAMRTANTKLHRHMRARSRTTQHKRVWVSEPMKEMKKGPKLWVGPFFRNPPSLPPPHQPLLHRSFCQDHPAVCIGVGAIGVGVGAACVFQPELCLGAIRIGIGLGRGIIGTVGAGAPVLAGAL